MLLKGHGELILGYYNGQMAAGSLFIDQNLFYRRIRELLGYGIYRFLIYDGVCSSYERGNSAMFSLGNFDSNTADKKLWNIQFFKKGFCEKIIPTILWKKQLPMENK